VQLVQQQHPAADLAQQAHRYGFAVWRAAVYRAGHPETRQHRRIQPPNRGRWRHLHQQHRDDLVLAILGRVLRVGAQEMLGDDRLAVVGGADHEKVAGPHAAGLGREQALQ